MGAGVRGDACPRRPGAAQPAGLLAPTAVRLGAAPVPRRCGTCRPVPRVRGGTDGLRRGGTAALRALAGSPASSVSPAGRLGRAGVPAPRGVTAAGRAGPAEPRGQGAGRSVLPPWRAAAAPGNAGGQWHLLAAAPHCTHRPPPTAAPGSPRGSQEEPQHPAPQAGKHSCRGVPGEQQLPQRKDEADHPGIGQRTQGWGSLVLPVPTQTPGLAHPRLHGPSWPAAPPTAPIPQHQAQLSSSWGPSHCIPHAPRWLSPAPCTGGWGCGQQAQAGSCSHTLPHGVSQPWGASPSAPQAAQGLASPTCTTVTATQDRFNSKRAIVMYLVARLAPKTVSSQQVQITHRYSAWTPALILSLTVSSPSFSDGSSGTHLVLQIQAALN